MSSIPTGYLQATYVWSATGSTRSFVNVLGHKLPSGMTGNPNGAAQALFLLWKNALVALQRSVITFERVDVAIGNDGGSILGSYTAPAPGTATGDPASINTAILVKKVTNGGGRKNRGRMFLPGMVLESSVDVAGKIATAALANVQGGLNSWLSTLDASGGTGSDVYGAWLLHSDPLDLPTRIVALTATPIVGTQRRRVR